MNTACKHNMTLNNYIEEKLRMIKKDFKIKLTQKEIDHFWSLQNEIQVDNYARVIFFEKLSSAPKKKGKRD